MRLPPADKLAHVIGGATAGAVTVLVLSAIPGAQGINAALAALIGATMAALAREAYNVKHGGAWDWADIAATLIGGAIMALPLAAVVALV